MNKTKPYKKIEPIWEYEYSFKWNQKTKYWTLSESGKIKGKDLTTFKLSYFKSLIELRQYFSKILSIANIEDNWEIDRQKENKTL